MESYLAKDGRQIPVNFASSVLTDNAGRAHGMVCVALDITERKQAEKALNISRASFHNIVQRGTDGIVVVGKEGMILFFNQSAEKIFGWDAGDMLGERFGLPLVAGEVTEIDIVRRGGLPGTGEMRQSETEWDGKPAFLVLIHDTTARNQAEEAERKKVIAEEANRAKSEFLSKMSHELRTPLNAILGFGQLLQTEGLEDTQTECVDQMMQGGRHLLDLVNEILDIARIEAGHMQVSLEPVNLPEAVAGILNLIQPLADSRGVRCHCDEKVNGECHVLADPQRLRQILLNLTTNAVKYNRDGGSVFLTWERTTDQRLRINVRDTGPGIPEDQLDRLFIPFERLDAEQRGIEGTGLALTKSVAEAMEGTVGVESATGVGSTFWVELPAHDVARIANPAHDVARIANPAHDVARIANPAHDVARIANPLGKHRISNPGYEGIDPPRPDERRSDAAPGSNGPCSILYIEDNPSNLKLIEEILEARPRVLLRSAMLGKSGLDLAREHHFDLILLDLDLPDISGKEVLHRLKADSATRDVPVIAVSADATPAQIQNLRQAGAKDYLTKPFEIDQLLRIVDEY